jgi:hypothetical protein
LTKDLELLEAAITSAVKGEGVNEVFVMTACFCATATPLIVESDLRPKEQCCCILQRGRVAGVAADSQEERTASAPDIIARFSEVMRRAHNNWSFHIIDWD